MDILLNNDVVNLKESSTLLINQRVKNLRAQNKDVVHFGFGQSPFPVHPLIVEELKKYADVKDYYSTQGSIELRENICSFYKRHFNYDFLPKNIIVGPGSKELIFQTLFILEGTVIIPAPSWVSYGPQVNIRGKHVSKVLTKLENDYKLTADELQTLCSSLTAKQKILVVNSPNNPTGSVYSDEEIQSLVEVCKKNNVIVISDEIYALIDFTGTTKKGFYHYYPEGTIVTAGLSKSHSAGGYRLGFLATSENFSKAINSLCAMVSETFSAVSAPVQHAAMMAYSDKKEIIDYVHLCTDIHKAASTYLYNRFKDLKLELSPPSGAFYLFPSFKNHTHWLKKTYNINTSVDLAKCLLEQQNVAILPGADFYRPDEELVARVATVDYDGADILQQAKKSKSIDSDFIEQNAPNLKKGCDRLKAFLSQ